MLANNNPGETVRPVSTVGTQRMRPMLTIVIGGATAVQVTQKRICYASLDQFLAFHFPANPLEVTAPAPGLHRFDVNPGQFAASMTIILPANAATITTDSLSTDTRRGTSCGGPRSAPRTRPRQRRASRLGNGRERHRRLSCRNAFAVRNGKQRGHLRHCSSRNRDRWNTQLYGASSRNAAREHRSRSVDGVHDFRRRVGQKPFRDHHTGRRQHRVRQRSAQISR
jgi:hypothetical protein